MAGWTRDGDLRLRNGWVIDRAYGHLTHGYAVTSYAAQGKTVDRILLAQSAASFPASSAEQFYVAVSRGREQVTVFTDHAAALREAVAHSSARPSATDLVASRDHAERQAHRRRYTGLVQRVRAQVRETVQDLGRWTRQELARIITPTREVSYER